VISRFFAGIGLGAPPEALDVRLPALERSGVATHPADPLSVDKLSAMAIRSNAGTTFDQLIGWTAPNVGLVTLFDSNGTSLVSVTLLP